MEEDLLLLDLNDGTNEDEILRLVKITGGHKNEKKNIFNEYLLILLF